MGHVTTALERRIVSFHDLIKNAQISAIVNVGEHEHSIHEGRHFTALSEDNIAAAGVSNVIIRTPATASSVLQYHLIAYTSSDKALSAELREDVEISASGTVLEIHNSFRSSTIASELVCRRSATITASGTLLGKAFDGGGAGAQAIGGDIEGRDTWILKHGTVYLIRVVAASNDSEIEINPSWEETEHLV